MIVVTLAVLVAVAAPFLLLVGMLGFVDRLARARGFRGADPFSPAVAWCLVIWVVLCCFYVFSIRVAIEAHAARCGTACEVSP